MQTHFETWLALSAGQGDESPHAHIEQAFRRYLDCGILANGFARAHCDECGHDFLIAFSCKGRGVCPSCNTRRMAETTAHLTDHVFPRLPVRQWVLSVPKRLRYFLQRDTALQGAVLRILLRGVEYAPMTGDDSIPVVGPSRCHRQQWPRSRPSPQNSSTSALGT